MKFRKGKSVVLDQSQQKQNLTAARSEESESSGSHNQAGDAIGSGCCRRIVELSRDALLIVKTDGTIQYANPAAEKIFGYTTDEFRTQPGLFSRLLQPDSREQFENILRTFCISGTLSNQLTVWGWTNKHGVVVRTENTLSPLPDEASGMQGILLSARNVTDIPVDATRRRMVEESLRVSEERYRTLVETVNEVIFSVDTGGHITFMSPTIERVAQYRVDEVVGQPFSRFVHSDDLPGLMKSYERSLEGIVEPYEFRIVTKDGTIRSVLSSSRRQWKEGRPVGLIGVLTDLTEHKRSEEFQNALYKIAEAADRSENLTTLYRSVHAIISTVMPAQNFYIALYKPEDNTISFPYYVDEVDTVSDPSTYFNVGRGVTAYVLRTGNSLLCDAPTEKELTRRGEIELVGSESAVWLGVPLKIGEGIIGVMAVQHYSDPQAYGIREKHLLEFVSGQIALAIGRKKRESELRESEERFRLTFEHAHIGMCLVAPTGRLLAVNKTLSEMLGHSREELLRLPYATITHPDDVERSTDWCEAMLAGSDVPHRMELRYVHKSGETIWANVGTTLLKSPDGAPLYFITEIEDITERKRANEALEANERKLRQIIDLVPHFIFAKDLDGKFILVNQAVANAYGTTVEDLTGRTDADFAKSEEEVRHFRADDLEVIQAGIPKLIPDEPITDSTGRMRRLSTTKIPFTFSGTKQSCVLGVSVDITERLQAEEQLRRRLREVTMLHDVAIACTEMMNEDALIEWFTALLNRTLYPVNVGVLLAHPATGDLDVHPSYINLIGSYGKTCPAGKGICGRVVQTGRSYRAGDVVHDPYFFGPSDTRSELCVPLKVGEQVIGVINVENREPDAYTESDEELLLTFAGFIATAIARLRGEAGLRKAEERYRKFFEEDLSGNYIATPDGKLLECNLPFARMFGFDSVEAAKQSNLGALYPTLAVRSEFLELLKTRKYQEYHEVQGKTKEGKPLYLVENVVGIFDEHGELIQFKGYLFDDTRRKDLEVLLVQAQKMESVGTLAGGIAHDFNNILGIIRGYSSILPKLQSNPVKFIQAVEAIQTAVSRGTALVSQLLTFARKTDVHLEDVQINDNVLEVAQLLNETFPKVISIQTMLQKQLPLLKADPNQMHQVLVNLCVNGRDAMLPKGGTLSLSTDLVPVGRVKAFFPHAGSEEYVLIIIGDTGVGMDETTRRRAFEPFFTTKQKGKGTGLGLSVVYGIIENHGGHISIESKPGVGTTVRIYLPIPAMELTAARAAIDVPAAAMGGSETIMLVEDEELLRALMAATLREQGYTVLTANDGREAATLFRENAGAIALVLSDIGLPYISGIELYDELKTIQQGVKVILASGYIDPEQKSELLKAGVKDIIPKPYDLTTVLNTIRKILDA